jgi:hypothetical protein
MVKKIKMNFKLDLTDMVKGTVYKSNGKIEDKSFSKKNVTLKEMQEVVGGYIEFLYLKNNLVMIVNEEGKMIGLPYNPKATLLVQENNINEIIVGDVLVVNQKLIK